ncbi:MAG: cold shock domain-containing protein [Clostridiales bacterium]|nr:cold shock domain-containing protein [Clostridiales bacterium]
MQGVVKWFNDQKGYGFITADDGGDVFVHYSGIAGTGRRTLYNGNRVSYDVETVDSERSKAVNVKVMV